MQPTALKLLQLCHLLQLCSQMVAWLSAITNCMTGGATMHMCCQQVLPAYLCERSHLTGLLDRHTHNDQSCALPTSCIAAECKNHFKACTSSHITPQQTQCMAIHLTGFCDGVSSTFKVLLCAGTWGCMSSNKAAEDKAAMHAGVTCLN